MMRMLLKQKQRLGHEELYMSFREGFDLAKLRIPKRIFEVPTPHGLLKEEDVRKAIEIYGEMIEGVQYLD